MNATIRIGPEELPLDQADQGWINQQINRRRADGTQVCVQVRIAEGDVDVVLRTPTCGPGMGGTRRANAKEQRVIELWNERGLNEANFTGGNITGFLQQVRRFL